MSNSILIVEFAHHLIGEGMRAGEAIGEKPAAFASAPCS